MKALISKVNKISQIKPQTGQGRAGLRRKKPYVSQLNAQSVKHSLKILELPKIEKQVINIPFSQSLCIQSVIPVLNQLTEE